MTFMEAGKILVLQPHLCQINHRTARHLCSDDGLMSERALTGCSWRRPVSEMKQSAVVVLDDFVIWHSGLTTR